MVVVNYEHDEQAKDLAAGVRRMLISEGAVAECILVDNSSGIQTAPGVDAVVRLDNPGYAAAVNCGVSALTRKFEVIVVLTHECKIGRAGLVEMIAATGLDGVGAAGPVLVENTSGEVLSAGKKFGIATCEPLYEVRGNGSSDWPRVVEVGGVDGGAWCLRGSALRDVGPLSEDYFLYWEETDWQDRARARGWKIVVCAAVFVHGAPSERPQMAYYMARNRIVFFRRRRSSIRWMLGAVYYGAKVGVSLGWGLTGCGGKEGAGERVLRDKYAMRGLWDGILGRSGRLLE